VSDSACTKKAGVAVVPSAAVITMLALPAPVAVLDTSSRVGSALAIVTGTPPAGAGAPSDTTSDAWRFCPTVTLGTENSGAVTAAEIELSIDGIVKPAGGCTLIVVVPPAIGWNAVVCVLSPPAKCTGSAVNVPIVGSAIASATSTPIPPRSGCDDPGCSAASS